MLLSEIIREISVDLNDQEPGHEYTRWSVEQLQTYVREGLAIVSRTLKDLFTEQIIVKVLPGAGWQTACDCSAVLRIIGEVDKHGNILRYLSRGVDKVENTWPGNVHRCSANPRDYVMLGYTISATQDEQFRVVPPVPPGADRYVLVECYKRPAALNLGDSVPDEISAVLSFYAQFRALSIDSENNPTIVALAKQHYQTFQDTLALLVKIREAEHKELEDSSNGWKAPTK